MKLFTLKKWFKLAAFSSGYLLMLSNAHATTWTYLPKAPVVGDSVCSAVTNGSALLVVGVEGCSETAPWAAYSNMTGSPTYHKGGSSAASIEQSLVNWNPSPLPSNTPPWWLSGWTKSAYAGLATVYVYLSSDNTDPGFCGIPSSGTSVWPDLYQGNSAKNLPFPWGDNPNPGTTAKSK